MELVGCSICSHVEDSFPKRSSLLGSVLEVTNKLGNIVLVFFSSLALRDVAHLGNEILECAKLLRTNLLENVWHHVLKLLSLWVASDNEQVLSYGELDYRRSLRSAFVFFTDYILLRGLLKCTTVLSSLNILTSSMS